MSALEDWEFRIAKLELACGDVLVVKTANGSGAHGHEILSRLVPPGVKVLYIPPDVDLSVLTRAEIEERAR